MNDETKEFTGFTRVEILDDPVLYILMRTDLESMNPGKAVAQGVHAGNLFTHKIKPELGIADADTLRLYNHWSNMTDQGFGTTIALGVDGDLLFKVVIAADDMGAFAGIAHDPSYPLQDGDFTHLIPLDTCGFVFGDKAKLEILLRQFNLMK